MKMIKLEDKIMTFLLSKKELIFLAAITLLGVIVRIGGKDFTSGDYNSYLSPWYDTIRENGGFASLSVQVGNYGIPYQFLIAVMTYIPINKLYLYKALSCVFDFGLAFVCAKFAVLLKYGEERADAGALFAIIYGSVLFMPTVVLNSSVWAQCDSIFVFFAVAALYALYRGKHVRAFIFLGLSFAFKLQAIFVLPFILYDYLKAVYTGSTKKCSIVFGGVLRCFRFTLCSFRGCSTAEVF